MFNLKPNKWIKGLIFSNSLKVNFVLLLLLFNKIIGPCINTTAFLNTELLNVLIVNLLSIRWYFTSTSYFASQSLCYYTSTSATTSTCTSTFMSTSTSTSMANFNSTPTIYRSALKKEKEVYLFEIMFNFRAFISF